jgi:hypothetical protein
MKFNLSLPQWARRLTALVLILAVLLCLANAFSARFGERLVNHSLQNSQRMDADFQAAARFVDDSRSRTGRFVTDEEVEAWARSRSGASYEPFIIDHRSPSLFHEGVSAVGAPPQGSYLLGVWRGEWMEYYAPWSGKSTLERRQGDYYATGSRQLDLWGSLLLAILGAVGAVVLWRKPHIRLDGSAP